MLFLSPRRRGSRTAKGDGLMRATEGLDGLRAGTRRGSGCVAAIPVAGVLLSRLGFGNWVDADSRAAAATGGGGFASARAGKVTAQCGRMYQPGRAAERIGQDQQAAGARNQTRWRAAAELAHG